MHAAYTTAGTTYRALPAHAERHCQAATGAQRDSTALEARCQYREAVCASATQARGGEASHAADASSRSAHMLAADAARHLMHHIYIHHLCHLMVWLVCGAAGMLDRNHIAAVVARSTHPTTHRPHTHVIAYIYIAQ